MLDERSAEKVGKLSSRAKAGDEGSAIAQRHVEALAKKHCSQPTSHIRDSLECSLH